MCQNVLKTRVEGDHSGVLPEYRLLAVLRNRRHGTCRTPEISLLVHERRTSLNNFSAPILKLNKYSSLDLDLDSLHEIKDKGKQYLSNHPISRVSPPCILMPCCGELYFLSYPTDPILMFFWHFRAAVAAPVSLIHPWSYPIPPIV